MANRIKGITVEIGGDTTKLQTALKGVNSEIRNTQAQLRDVDKLLKLDPGNTDLLVQRHRLLGQAVEETRGKLETLKTAQEQANTALANGTISQAQYDALQREIIETENELRRLEEQANSSATAVQKIGAAGDKLQALGGNISSVGQKFLPVTGAVTALGAAAVKTAADFDSAMSQVAAVSGATGSDLEALREKAREMGANTKFSASEAAEAMNYMAMAGWKTGDMLSGIEGIMNLAAASGEDLATTSDIVTDALTAFGLSASDSGHFADILAAASSNANTNVSMMGETFKYCAPVAGALGFSAADTAEAIGLMANAGIKSSQAGTAMRTMLTSLSGDVTFVGDAFGELTVQTVKSDGSMRSLGDIMTDCRAAFSQMTDSEKAANAEALVGKNAMSGFLAVMNAAPDDIEKLNGEIINCDGTAEKMAATMQDNLAGQLTILKSQLEELAISFGELLMPAIRAIVGWIQQFVNWLNGMDEGTKKTVVTVALLAAALGPVLIVVGKVISVVGTIMSIVPKIAGVINTVKTAFAALNVTMLANPIVLIIAAIAALVAAFIYLWTHCEGFREFWIGLWENIKAAAVAVWNGLKDFFAAAWNGIVSVAQTVWNSLAAFFAGLWDGMKNVVTTVVTAISDFLNTAWNTICSAISTVLAAIHTVVSTVWNGILSAVTTIVNGILSVISTVWNAIQTVITTVVTAISGFLTGAWNGIRTVITSVVNGIHGVVTSVWGAIQNAVASIVNGIRSTVTNVWNSICSAVSSAVNGLKTAVGNAFTAMWNGIRSTVSGIYNSIKSGFDQAVGFITGLASSAWNWGADIVNGIANGIRAAVGNVVDAVRSIADKIAAFLHFSVPDEGPLHEYERWMPDFMAGLARGIDRSRGLVEKAVGGLAADMVVSPKMGALEYAVANSSPAAGSADMVPGIVAGITEALSGLAGAGGDIVIPVYLGGALLDEVVVNAQNRMNLRSGGR